MRIKKEYLSIDAYTIRSSFSGSLEYRGCSSFAIRANEPQALEDMIRQASDLRFNWRMGANKHSEE
jgi:hypothetical protein